MEKSIHLAIASVPVQQWGEIYDEPKAFWTGTIFPELDKPFYVLEEDGRKEQECSCGCDGENTEQGMLTKIQQTAFFLDDLRLYLDTHPQDEQALKCFKSTLKRKIALTKEFAEAYYPLTLACMVDIYEKNPDSDCYCWPKGRIPWEGVCK